jgi:hypothetical protein
MDIYVQSTIGTCDNFIGDDNKKSPISIIISPTKLITEDEKNVKIQNGCSMWRGCHNAKCYYSLKARTTTDKIQKK